MFKYDSVHGRFRGKVEAKEGKLFIEDKAIHVFDKREPKDIPWGDARADYIVESTGIFTTKEQYDYFPNALAKLTY